MNAQLQEWLKSHGYTFTPELTKPNSFVNYKDKDEKVWYIYKQVGEKLLFTFGDFRTGEQYTFKSSNIDFDESDEDYRKLQEQLELEKEKGYQDAWLKSLELLNKSTQHMLDPYSEKKGFDSPYPTTYQLLNHYQTLNLLIPMRDVDGKVWNIQTIEPEGFKQFLVGGKYKGLFHNLTPENLPKTIYITEGFSTARSVKDILTPLPPTAWVVCAFSSTNLQLVGKVLKEKYPDAHLVFCADNDHLKEINVGLKMAVDAAFELSAQVIYPKFMKDQTGTDWNDAIRILGYDAAASEFKSQIETPNDLNHLLETNYGQILKAKTKKKRKTSSKKDESRPNTQTDFGDATPNSDPHSTIPETVREETHIPSSTHVSGSFTLTHSQNEAEVDERFVVRASTELERLGDNKGQFLPHISFYMNGLKPMKMKQNRKGDPVLPSDQEVAHYILSYYESKKMPLMRWGDKDLFQYTGTHWRLLASQDIASLKSQIQIALRGAASASRVESSFRVMLPLVKSLPVNPFVPNPQKISFKNKTLLIEQNPSTREWSLKVTSHNPSDFISHLIPYDFDETAENPHFLKMLDNIFTQKDGTPDPEKDAKIGLLQEMYGACLAPIFPHLFLLWGPAGSGKTSVINCAMRLVDQESRCSIEPHEMLGFVLQGAAGKLVNFVTDINVTKPIEDSTIKRIEDRIPIRIDRKFKDSIYAPLPSIHIFGGNDIPSTKDLTSNAMLRRWSFIKMSAMDRSENPDFNYANWAFEQNPAGVVSWAFKGLLKLLKNEGKYSTFKSDRNAVREWQSSRDHVQQFLNDIESGEGSIGIKKTAEKDPKKGTASSLILWQKFVIWHGVAYGSAPKFGKIVYYRTLQEKGFKKEKFEDGYAFWGLCVTEK